jgi:hypothetical protein
MLSIWLFFLDSCVKKLSDRGIQPMDIHHMGIQETGGWLTTMILWLFSAMSTLTLTEDAMKMIAMAPLNIPDSSDQPTHSSSSLVIPKSWLERALDFIALPPFTTVFLQFTGFLVLAFTFNHPISSIATILFGVVLGCRSAPAWGGTFFKITR